MSEKQNINESKIKVLLDPGDFEEPRFQKAMKQSKIKSKKIGAKRGEIEYEFSSNKTNDLKDFLSRIGEREKADMLENNNLNEEVKAEEIIKDLANTDWGEDNDKQMKAVQLLKGLALSEDPKSNEFMKKLSDASTVIGREVIGDTVKEEKDDEEKDMKDDKKDMKKDMKNENVFIDQVNDLL